jgi:hypothetical protein
MKALKIIDIIDHRNKYSTQRFVVLNRNPNYVYEQKGEWLIADDSGFFSFFYRNTPSGSFYAFAGRKFEIPIKDGSVKKAYGQWWDGVPEDYHGLVEHIGYGTPDDLARCNVFCGGNVDLCIIEDWLLKGEPSNNYHKYDKRHPDFGKHKIISKFEEIKI